MIAAALRDREFLNKMRRIAVPVALQALIMSSLNSLDTFMITELSTDATAGVGLANQIFFFFSFFLFGLNTGSSILFSRDYGAGEIAKTRKTMGYSLYYAFFISLVFTVAAYFFPARLMGLFDTTQPVIEAGAKYLRAVSTSYIVTSFSFAIGIGMRSVGNPRTPLVASFVSFFVNSFFNYCFIFGAFGMPALGVTGAAVGTILARLVEFLILAWVFFRNPGPLFGSWKAIFPRDSTFHRNFIRVVFPVIVEEVFWSLSQVMYSGAYAKIGPEATASVQVALAISGVLYVGARGLASATTVLVGIALGRAKTDEAQDIALKSSALALLMGLMIGALLVAAPSLFLRAFPGVTPTVAEMTRRVLIVLGIFYGVRTYNSTTVVGVLRGGGDIPFSMTVELACAWFVGVPLAFIGVSVLHYPLHLVMALIGIEEVVKAAVVTPRILRRKWMRAVH